MPRLAGVDIPNNKKVSIALRSIYGIGPHFAMEIVKKSGVDPDVRAKNLTEDDLSRLATILENDYIIEGSLRRELAQNIGRLKEINCYKGIRHRKGLPVNGQRTKTNARTRKGKRKVVAGKKGVKDQR